MEEVVIVEDFEENEGSLSSIRSRLKLKHSSNVRKPTLVEAAKGSLKIESFFLKPPPRTTEVPENV